MEAVVSALRRRCPRPPTDAGLRVAGLPHQVRRFSGNAATPGELFVGDRHYGLRTNTGPRRLRVPSLPGYGISRADSRKRPILRLERLYNSLRLVLDYHFSLTLLFLIPFYLHTVSFTCAISTTH